jgi:hypothetical protein
MPVTIQEKFASRRWRGGDSPTLELEYVVTGTDDPLAARNAVMASTPAVQAGLVRREPTLEMVNDDTWYATVQYSGPETEFYGQVSFEFDIGSQSTKMFQSLATLGAVGAPGITPPIFNGAVNVTDSGVEGVDVEVPTCEWTETWRFPGNAITGAYATTLYLVTGTVNLFAFRGFAPGEVLFRGASGRKTSPEAWELSYRFAASPNASGLFVGGIGPLIKRGWEYVWVLYEEREDVPSQRIVKKPVAAYVEQVYPFSNFSLLGIGS